MVSQHIDEEIRETNESFNAKSGLDVHKISEADSITEE